jgi:hypothetical protein
MSYRPVRERDPETAVEAAGAILDATGYEELGLTSLSAADYTYIKEVASSLRARRPDVTISLPSTRVDSFTVELIDAAAPGGRRGGFTLAPEAGSQRLRDVINKGVSDEEIERCADLVFGNGWSSLKLYFMIGLPGETMDDVLAIHGRGLELRWTDPRVSILEAALGRGDRRLAAVIRKAWQKGTRFDAWDEHFRFDAWQEAFAEEGLDPAWYAQRDIPLEEPLPWGHLSCGVSDGFLASDYERAMRGRTLADCHWGACPECGVAEATGFRCRTGEDGPRRLLSSKRASGRAAAAEPSESGTP